jgi:alpha-L-fucosidase
LPCLMARGSDLRHPTMEGLWRRPTEGSEGLFHNSDAIRYFAEDLRFTTNAGVLDAIELGWPSSRELEIHSLKTGIVGDRKIASVEFLKTGNLHFQPKNDGLHIELPQPPPGECAYVYKIRFAASE